MCGTNTGKSVGLLLVVVLAIAVFTGQASAYTGPYRLFVFTDKQAYLDYGYDFDDATLAYTATDNAKGSFNQRPNVFAILLDSDGNIVKGLTGSNFSATLKDVERWNHSGQADYPYYQVIPTNGAYYNNLGFPAFTDADGDGIFNSSYDVTDLNQLGSPPPRTDHVNISINVTVRYQGTNFTQTVSVIFGTAGCHHPTNTITSAHAKNNHNNVICTACHWGYQYALGVHGPNNSIMYNDPARYTNPDTAITAGYDYKLGYAKTGGNASTWDNTNASFCVMCHGGPTNANILDLGVGNTPASADQNNDGLADNSRPSCSWYQGPLGNNSAYPVCHSPQIGSNGSTKITQSQLFNIDWKGWSQTPGKSKSHNHSVAPSTNGTPCEVCHAGSGAPGTGTGGMHQVAGLPNRSTDYTNINEQCWGCHNTTDGWLNITSNGGIAKNHSKTNRCSNCHNENNKLDAHAVPVGAYGGRWCLNCHNLTGKAPIDMRVDPAIADISNKNYTHYALNNNSDAANSSRICWGCHTNNSAVINGRVNSTSLPVEEHVGSYDMPRNCTSCHNNSNAAYNFGAPQTYRHTWYATDMHTSAVTYCTSCHAQDEMLNPWEESVYPPKTDNESASHYGRNRTLSFPPIGSREYCGYCHQNESTVMGPFANPNNKVRSDHASQNTTPNCGNNLCHKPGRMHEDTLVVPFFVEDNIDTTCRSCHSYNNYNSHNGTVTCWDCHMGNVSNYSSTWIHPIQFIQYNGNFTGAKLTGATCYDCHKSTNVDSTIQNLSGTTAPKVYNQAHSNDPMNGTKWGDYWKYTPTTYEFASYYVGNGTINPVYPFDNIKVPSNDYMELIENRTGSSNGPVTFPYNKIERQIEGPPVPNWTYSTQVTAGTTTLTVLQDAAKGNPAGSLRATLKTKSTSGTGNVTWNYSFYYKPDTYQYAYTNISVDYNITVSSGLMQNVYLRLVKPSGAVVILDNASCCAAAGASGWLTLTNTNFGPALNEDGSVTPYKIQLHSELAGTGTKSVQNPYTVYYDNILLKFQEKVWNMYEITINTTGVPVNGSSRLGMSYQAHMENTSLFIYNRTLGDYELLDTLDKGVFFDYVKNINSTHHINSTDGITGNVSVKFVDTDRSDRDAVTDKFHIRYLYVYTDRGLQYPCEQCHSPNKHYVSPTLGSPEKFNASNRVGQLISGTSTWCQQCHWQGAANYSLMIKEYNTTRNPPENIPPEITGNATYAPAGGARDGTGYVDHTGYDLSDAGCFSCHGKTGDTTTSRFVHNVLEASSGGKNCTACHNIGGSRNNVNFSAISTSMHAKLNSGAQSTAANATDKPCWGCHGTVNASGFANESDQPDNGHNLTVYKNPRKCSNCHITDSLKFTTKNVTDHIPSGYTAKTDVNTSSYNFTYCSYCHNNSVNDGKEPDTMGITGGSPMNASVSHYGANRTANRLMSAASNSTDCVYCHRNSSNMPVWGILPSSPVNISNKVSHNTYISSTQCSTCHGGYVVSAGFTFHNGALGPGGGGGPNCINCHDTGAGGSSRWINASVMKQGVHKYLNRNATNTTALDPINKACWACHGSGEEDTGHHTWLYSCLDCHNRTDNLTFTTNITIRAELNGRKVAEHIQGNYYENISSTRNYPAVNCTFCHNQSVLSFYDTASGSINANVSHYADNSSIASPTVVCSLCHKNTVNAGKYGANITRHPARTQDILYCRYCHNTTNASSLHSQSLDFRFGSAASIHGGSAATNYWGFDWEEDDWNESRGLAPRNEEGCNSCHFDSANFSTYANTCENCHLPDSTSLFTGPRNRKTGLMRYNSSVNDTIPRVYSHTNYSAVNVPNQSRGGVSGASGCYGFGNATCHGVDYFNRSTAGGYFAYNYQYGDKAWKSDPYHFTNTIDRMPDTKDCLFCHNQSNATIRAAWGNAMNPSQTKPAIHTGNMVNTKCYECHTTDKSAPRDFHASTLIPSIKGNPNCVGCHNVSGSFPNIDVQVINSSIHGILNNQASSSPANASNKPCWGCHGTVNAGFANESDQPPDNHNLTVYKNPRKCYECHVTGSLQFTTHNVTDHIPPGYTASTDVNTSSYNFTYCSYCHNNSVNSGYDSSMGLSNGGSPMNASVSHYGANRTAGKLMSAASNSTDCVYCHRNSSNTLVKWGILPGSLANISNKNNTGGGTDHSLYVSGEDCKSCHGGYSVVSGFTFHSAALGNGSGGAGGKDCKSCHDIGRSTTGKLVNFSAMNSTDAIHKNLNSIAAASVDAENKKCWACHGDGSEPPAHPANYKSPYNCTDCHTSAGSQSGKYNGLNVTEHVKPGTVSGTEIFTSGAGNCYTCHNASEMMISAGDPDSGSGAIYGGANGGNNSTSHYGLKRNLGSGDTYCNYCHSNTSSVFYLSAHNKSIFEHTTNTSADVRNNSLNCSNAICHSTGRIHNGTLVKPVQTNWTQGQKDYCAPCHNSTGSANKKVFKQWHDPGNSSTDNITSCNYCHDSGSLGNTSLTYALNVHSDNLTYPAGTTTCVACHNASSTYVKGRKILTHFPGASRDKGNTSLSARTCELCHGIAGQSMHASGLVKKPNYVCEDCHVSTSAGPFWANQSFNSYIDTTSHDNTSTPNVTTCAWCHNNSNAKEPFHFTEWANGSVASPGWGGWQAGKPVNCTDCHDSANNNKAPFYAPGKPHAGTGNNTDECYLCHTNVNNYAAAPLAVHTVIQAPGNANCTRCHDIGGAASKEVDVAAMNKSDSIHLNLNIGAANANATAPYAADSKRCWACHGDGSDKDEHDQVRYKNPYKCEDCHTQGGSQSGRYPSFNVSEHYAFGADIRTPGAVQCQECHNKSEMVKQNSDAVISSPNASVGHYGRKRALDGIDYPLKDTIAYCNKCHSNSSSVFPFADQANKTIANHSMNYASTNPSCLDSRCHATGRIHNSTLIMPGLILHNSTYCTSCHTGKERHNSTGPATGINCTECHLNSSRSIHPVRYLENTGSTWSISNSSAVNCTSCHQGAGLSGFAKARIIPAPMNHSTNTWAGGLWGNYWNNRSQQDSCRYCHGNVSYHNSSGLGLVQSVKGSNTVRMGFSGTWCANCHYQKAANYFVGAFNPVPPEVTTQTASNDPSVKWYNHSSDLASTYTDAKCIECHNNSLASVATSLNFTHNLAPSGGGPDCIACHDTGQGSAMVDVNAIKAGMHRNLKNASAGDTTGNPANKICWACHQSDGTQPGGHPDRKKNPYNCTDCHKNASRPGYVSSALQVSNHFKSGANITALGGSGTNDTSCIDCHLLAEMVASYTEPDSNWNSNSLSSHYGKNRSDMVAMGSDPYCNYCHSNSSSAFTYNKPHNRVISEHTSNATADVRNATTLNCIDCHTTDVQSYRLHNVTLTTPSANSWTDGKQDRCAPCHRTTGTGSSLKINNSYHNTTSGSISDCGYCHNSDAMKGSAPQNIHSDNLTRGGNSTYNNCYNCHQNGFASRVIIEHSNSTGANVTGTGMTCEKSGCHNTSRTHSKGLAKPAATVWTAGGNDYCAPCHNYTDSTNNATKKIYRQGHDPANRTNDNVTSCGNCHNASTPGGIPAPFRLHDTYLTNLSGSNDATCQGCHNGTSAYTGVAKQIFSHMPNVSQYRGNTTASSYDCKSCHNMTGKPSMHSAGMNRSNGTCETCHLNGISPYKSLVKNISQLAGGMLNHSYTGSSGTTCKMCHNASGRARFHLSKYASGDIADPQDSAGNPTFQLRDSWDAGDTNNRGILVECRDCHEKYNDTAPFNAPYFETATSPLVQRQEHRNKNYILKNCYVCHTNETNNIQTDSITILKPATLHNVSIEPLSGGPNCTKCHNIGATDPGKAPEGMQVNFTAFNATGSRHRNLTNATAWNNSVIFGLLDTACWACHQSDGKQPERHTDLKDEPMLANGSMAYKCEACHTAGGAVAGKQPLIYQRATRIYKHYAGSSFLGTIIFTGNVSCGMCHINSLIFSNISGYSQNIDANATNVSHYSDKMKLNTSQDLNGCKKCHSGGLFGPQYGDARAMPDTHNNMGASYLDCERSCHNTAKDINNQPVPVKLHSNSITIEIGQNACYSNGCHTRPPPPPPGTCNPEIEECRTTG